MENTIDITVGCIFLLLSYLHVLGGVGPPASFLLVELLQHNGVRDVILNAVHLVRGGGKQSVAV